MLSIEEILRQNLTGRQRDAALDPSREVFCLACAGSGKSRTLAFRTARLVAQGEDPAGIVAFTFTEKAADSIKLQVARALVAAGLEPTIIGAMYIGTIHSYCQYVLGQIDARYRQFDVLDENRLKLYLISRRSRLHLRNVQGAMGARYFETVRQVSNAWTMMNDEMVRIEDVSAHDPELGAALESLRAQLDEDEFIDFSLMIRLVADALRRNDGAAERAVAAVRHLMVDEYQDVNPPQEALIRELHRRCSTLFVVGDDDQAIYSWRGADVGNILNFRPRYPNCSEHTLSHNFRSTPAIVMAADGFVSAELGATRIAKNPEASDTTEPRDFRNLWFPARAQEAEWVAERIEALSGMGYREQNGAVRGLTPGDFAILMRSTRTDEQNGSPRHAAFTKALDVRGIRYTLEAGGGVFDRPQVSVLRDTFELLRTGSPTRETAEEHFNNAIRPAFPQADFDTFAHVMADWGREIHAPIDGARRRVYPQQLVHDLLNAFGIERSNFDPDVMQDLGVFSRIIQDVEAVYLSIDTAGRFQEILNFLQNVAATGYNTSRQDILRRPDNVTVSTVHKVKGLEFPVVFVVDVESQRFPGRRHSYSGWLPGAVIQNALNRGAYQSTRDEEARLFYTAVTRAERYLYVTGSQSLPGGRQRRQPSPFAQRLYHDEMSDDPDGVPEGLSPHDQVPRIDEAVVPTSFTDIRYYLRCPRDYRFRKSFGFSPAIPEMFGYGRTIHTAVGKLHEQFTDCAPTGEEAEEIARGIFHLKHVPESGDPVNRPGAYELGRDSAAQILRSYAETYAEDFTRRRQIEVRFEVPIEQAVISGTIDLMLHEDAEGNILDASVVEFKTMEGGEDPEESERLEWTELALQVQLYAKAAREVLGENARTGHVHLLKDNRRVDVPVSDHAVEAAVSNVEWAVNRIIDGDFPMRPEREKCAACDFKALCPKSPEQFATDTTPPAIHVPGAVKREMVRAFSDFTNH